VLYLVGRAFHLLAAQIPSLLIVFFQVVPPALFALIHGARIYGRRRILVFTFLCLGVGTLFESLSLRTGFPFGYYEFTDLMGPKIFKLPILLALAYGGMGYVSWVVALLILRYQDRPLTGRKIFFLPLVASFVMVAWDLSQDPVWSNIDRAWVWRDGGRYYGVPVSNFIGWYLTVFIFYQLFALYLRDRASARPQATWRLAILFYAACSLGNLLAPASLPATVIDASGRRWLISDILWASRLVSIFLMLPLSLIAWTATLTTRVSALPNNEPIIHHRDLPDA
jgi:putative membrane protein